jgi:predicted XRE-type DNA-binding protein
MKWPTQAQIDEAMKEMSAHLPSLPLKPGASVVDRLKFQLCAQFVIFAQSNQMSQQELADQIGIDKSLMSKILHYHLDEFTSDRLIKYLAVLDPALQIEVKAKVA